MIIEDKVTTTNSQQTLSQLHMTSLLSHQIISLIPLIIFILFAKSMYQFLEKPIDTKTDRITSNVFFFTLNQLITMSI